MEEVILMVNHIDIALLNAVQVEFDRSTRLWNELSGITSQILLTNGQREPIKHITADAWYRFRIIFMANQATGIFWLTNEDSCEFQLLAKDGVYLETAPRGVSSLELTSGARCDVAVRCSGDVEAVNLIMTQVDYPPVDDDDSVVNWNVLSLLVTTNISWSNAPLDIKSFQVNRPCHLSNTLEAVPNISTEILFGGDGALGLGSTVNGYHFGDSPDVYIESFETGELIEFNVVGLRVHPFHIHTYHFQIVEMDSYSDYYQKGDWHDTLVNANSGSAFVRFWTNDYSGDIVLHCHYMEHQDNGMLSLFYVGEGKHIASTVAPKLNPTCSQEASGRGFVYTYVFTNSSHAHAGGDDNASFDVMVNIV